MHVIMKTCLHEIYFDLTAVENLQFQNKNCDIFLVLAVKYEPC